MKRLCLLCLTALAGAVFSVGCDDGTNAGPPRPQPTGCGIIPTSSITEAQKAEAMQNIGQLKTAVQGLAVQPRYRGKMDQLANAIGGQLTDKTAQAMGFANAGGFNGRWYQASDYYVEYLGNGKWWLHAKPAADPAHISEEVLIR